MTSGDALIQKSHLAVIPAQAGIKQLDSGLRRNNVVFPNGRDPGLGLLQRLMLNSG